ncbi:MAG: cytochrome P450, partial [Olpidium bornovanus]
GNIGLQFCECENLHGRDVGQNVLAERRVLSKQVPYLKQVAPPAITAICAELVRKIEAKGQAPVDIHRLLCMECLQAPALTKKNYTIGNIFTTDNVLSAGHETTSATMCFAIMLLGVHTDWQNKARQEVDRVLGDRMSPTHEDQLQLKTLTMILKESELRRENNSLTLNLVSLYPHSRPALRLFPAAPGTVRITEKATPVIHFVLPPKVHIMPVFMAMQRHPKNFANPLKFDPTRWQTNKTAEEIDENVEEGSPKD